MKKPIHILLADDHDLFRKGLAAVLTPHPGIEVVGQACDGLEAVALARKTNPDVILMDIKMPNLSGLEATRQIIKEMPHLKIIVLTVSDLNNDIIEALKNGAHGYLLKDIKEQELVSTIKGVVQGEVFFSGVVAARILQEFQQTQEEKDEHTRPEKLTAREKEVLELIVDGLSNKEIASRLHVTKGTVKNHVSNILYKLHLNNRIEAAVYALRHGIGTPQITG